MNIQSRLHRKLTTALLVALTVGAAYVTMGTAKAQLFYDDFSADVPNYTVFPGYSAGAPSPYNGNAASPAGWTVNDFHVGVNSSASHPFGPTSLTLNTDNSAISSFAFLQGNTAFTEAPSMVKVLNGFTVGADVFVTYADAARFSDAGASLVASIYDGTYDPNGINVLLASFTTTPGTAQFYQEGFGFTAISSQATLVFSVAQGTAPNAADYSVALTNVAVTPEPSSYAFGLMVLAVLAFEIRRRAAKTVTI